MKRLFASVVLVFAYFLLCASSAAFLPGLLDERFSNRPYDKFIINGKAHSVTEVTKLPEDSLLILMRRTCEALAGCPEGYFNPFYYWVERRDSQGKLIWQTSPLELSIYSYRYSADGSGLPEYVKTEIIWPELSEQYWTPKLENCNPVKSKECYKFRKSPITLKLYADRDQNGRITDSILWSYFYTENGQTFDKRQEVIVTHPTPNSMRVEFKEYGEPWAYVDAWEEYRLEDGKIVWEACRRFPGMEKDPPCVNQ